MKHFLPFPSFLLLAGSLSFTALPVVAQQAAPTALYVNDAAITNDTYTQAPGNDATGDGTTQAPFATVARALQQAVAGTTTIFIDAGTYSERMVLHKAVSLRGAGTGTTVFSAGLPQSGARSHEVGLLLTAPGGTASAPLLIASLTIQAYDLGLETDGSARANVALEDVEILDQREYGIFWNSLGGVENLVFRRVHIARTAVDPANVRTNYNGSSSPAGRGLFLVNGTKHHITIEGGTYEQNRRAGIDINDGSVSDLVIRDAQFSQNGGAAMAILGAGGQRDANGNFLTPAALLERNTITNNGSNGLELKSATGNGQASGPGSFVVRENVITRLTTRPDPLPDGVLPEDIPTSLVDDNAAIAFIDRDRGVIQVGGGVTGDLVTGGAYIANNRLSGYIASEAQGNLSSGINGFGIVAEGSHNRLIGNEIMQCQIGIQVQERPANSSGLLGFGTPFFDINRNASVPATDLLIQDNSLDSCTQALVAVNLATPATAQLNWLGSTETSRIYGPNNQNGLVATISKAGSTFTREAPASAAGRLDYSPFLQSNTDADPAVGFQGDRSYLHVDAGSPTTGTALALKEGLDLVPEAGTLSTVGGTYEETLVVAKALTLTNTGPTTLRNLTIESPYTPLVLGAPFTVSGALTLTSGRIQTTNTALLTLSDSATATAGNAASFVEGPLRKVGAQAFVFPVGKAGQWARLGISAPATAAGFTAEYVAAAAPDAVTLAAPLHNVSQVEHWLLMPDEDTTENVAVQLFWENAFRSGINAYTEDLQVAHYDGATWTTAGQGALAGTLAAGAVGSAGAVSGYGAFTFGSLAEEVNPLVTDLSELRATETQPGTVQLTWSTQQTTTAQGFDVERSYDQQTWQSLAYVDGQATTQRKTYSYLDHPDRANITALYRLRQVLASGARVSLPAAVPLTPSITLPTRAATATAGISVYPNPATRELHVQFPTTVTGDVTLTLLDLTGRSVLTQTITAKGSNAVALPDSLPAGVYLARFHGKTMPDSVLRLVKQ